MEFKCEAAWCAGSLCCHARLCSKVYLLEQQEAAAPVCARTWTALCCVTVYAI